MDIGRFLLRGCTISTPQPCPSPFLPSSGGLFIFWLGLICGGEAISLSKSGLQDPVSLDRARPDYSAEPYSAASGRQGFLHHWFARSVSCLWASKMRNFSGYPSRSAALQPGHLKVAMTLNHEPLRMTGCRHLGQSNLRFWSLRLSGIGNRASRTELERMPTIIAGKWWASTNWR